VRDNHCCSSVHNGEGSRTSVDQKFDQYRLFLRSISSKDVASESHFQTTRLKGPATEVAAPSF
jgi:hypothetical protein